MTRFLPPLHRQLWFATALLAATPFAQAADAVFPIYAPPVKMTSADAMDMPGFLPPLPAGVQDLRFGEIYQTPVGDRGLEFSEKAQTLAGHRVRLLGYMVREDLPARGRLLLAPFPFTLFTRE
jgi:hypothetical protein